MPGNRCSDAHLIIQYLIQFDTISREKLFEKLLKHEINGNFLNVIKNMYFNDETRIKVGDYLSDVIYPNQGVRQGCILSPKPPETDRRCPFCPNFVENEIHFLLICPTFSIHRENFISLATRTIPNFRTLNDNEKFLVLMTENSIIKETANYLKTTFEVREFLTRPHKCNG